MSEEEILKSKLKVSAILFSYNVPVEEAKIIGTFIEELQQENSQLKEDIKGFEQERQTLYNTIHDLQKANKQLNRKIEKATEYIEEHKNYDGIGDIAIQIYSNVMLEILKGDKE